MLPYEARLFFNYSHKTLSPPYPLSQTHYYEMADSSKPEANTSDSDARSDYSASESDVGETYNEEDYYDEEDESPETTVKLLNTVLDSEWYKREEEEREKELTNFSHEEKFNFPPDPEDWREEDLKELWADGPLGTSKPGWDPNFVDEEDVDAVNEEIMEGNDPPIAPFYLPYRKPYPVIPDNHHDISTPKAVIEELDRIEEFLTWVSYVFEDGST